MSQNLNTRDQAEEDILRFDISDDELETAAGTGNLNGPNPTAPYAIICIPFERT